MSTVFDNTDLQWVFAMASAAVADDVPAKQLREYCASFGMPPDLIDRVSAHLQKHYAEE